MPSAEAERKRRERQLKKLALRDTLKTEKEVPSFLRHEFSVYLAGHAPTLELDENLDFVGVDIRGDLFDEVQSFKTHAEVETPKTALTRAIAMVGVFIDAAQELSRLVNSYMLAEVEEAIESAMAKHSKVSRADAAGKKALYAEIERLMAVRSELQKSVRQSFPNINVNP